MDEQLNGRILLVEDEELIAKAYTDGLQRSGLTVEVLTDGSEVLDSVLKEAPDLILLDLIMPGKDGFEVLRELKANQQAKRIPVVVLTVSGQEHDIRKVADIGAEDYLIKTELSMQQVLSRIKFQLLKSKS